MDIQAAEGFAVAEFAVGIVDRQVVVDRQDKQAAEDKEVVAAEIADRQVVVLEPAA